MYVCMCMYCFVCKKEKDRFGLRSRLEAVAHAHYPPRAPRHGGGGCFSKALVGDR